MECNINKKTLAAFNGREIPTEDKVFGTVARAKEAEGSKGKEKVINATAGVLKDDEGNTVVLETGLRDHKSPWTMKIT